MPNMLNKTNIAFGILIAHAMWCETVNVKLHRRCELKIKKFAEKEAELRYLVVMLNRKGIELDEFDLIALPSIKLEEIDQS